MKYRLYIDEVGDPGLKASDDPKYRYLSLTGVILNLEYVDRVVFPEFESLKRAYFHVHVDEPLIFHRKELINKRHPFQSLRDKRTEIAFNEDLLRLLDSLDYVVITVVIDKLEHRTRYQVWQQDPYHYSLRVLLERYVLFLQKAEVEGDVMAESRGGKEDRRLKRSYEKIFEEGTEYLLVEEFHKYLTSCRLKVKQKSNNIVGLQLADLIAHPSFRATLARRQKQGLPQNFGGKIARILERTKYYRSPSGRIDGWGRKWLP
jgi:hypothetical protein